MQIGKVIGTVVATRKNETLVGSKLLIVKPLNSNFKEFDSNEIESKEIIVAVDTVGAGTGEVVLLVRGSIANRVMVDINSPVDAAVIGIIDDMEISG